MLGNLPPAAQSECADAQAVFALVEGITPVPALIRIAIGDEQFRQRGAVQHRPCLSAIAVADAVQHQSLTRIQPTAKRPVLPAHLVPAYLEVVPLGTPDLKWLQRCAQRTYSFRIEEVGCI